MENSTTIIAATLDGYFWRALLLGVVLITCLLTGCQTLPATPHLAKSQQLTADIRQSAIRLGTPLLAQISHSINPNPATLSGYAPIMTSADAFAARTALTRLAHQHIDVQYYTWHNDLTGQLVLKALYDAANRGVMVRLLLDDLNTDPQFDQLLWRFAQHPNVAVRLMNPKQVRSIRALNFVTALPYYHRRMHNKVFSVDNQLAIIGGRNIGDEYLRSDLDDSFADLDVLLAGHVVNDVQASFDTYWASPLAVDIELLVKPSAQTLLQIESQPDFLTALTQLSTITPAAASSPSSPLANAVRSPALRQVALWQEDLLKASLMDEAIEQKKLVFRWAAMRFFADDPSKLHNQDSKDQRLVRQLRQVIGTPRQRFSMISSYFVPTRVGINELAMLAEQGVKVALLTNSFDSTDVPIVHSGYSETRRKLLTAGITLYELKASADPDFRKRKHRLTRKTLSTSLHTKAFAVDDRLVFIGSYNIDPRSANLNTELGVVIFDKALARSFHQAFDSDMLNISYRLQLDANHHLTWETRLPANDQRLDTQHREPNISRLNSLWIQVLSRLPIDWLL